MKQPDQLAAEARRWLAGGRRGRRQTPWTPAQLAVRRSLGRYYGDLDAVFPLRKDTRT